MITDGDAVWTMVQCPSVEDRGTSPPHEPLGMLADHDELIDAEARQPLTSRQFDIECGSVFRLLTTNRRHFEEQTFRIILAL
jgi:hypothetical protein